MRGLELVTLAHFFWYEQMVYILESLQFFISTQYFTSCCTKLANERSVCVWLCAE
jgi:hypothetical protein